ncbi:hypothetical protein CANMA_003486 [Candida margitis]|uniref:uncharacterized protein n=1 Tax=Candida margitis TaxID=1775924 RepID=UPI002226095D|nr:uncharacterized protein CANMA_003486 [Candida margitis]KAI5964975.1 hypothetical protein CANMA_003486 [Candida margitis]
MSKTSANTAKKLMNLLYKETATNVQTSHTLPQITRQLYNENTTSTNETNSPIDSSMDILHNYQTTKRKLPAMEALKVNHDVIPIKSNILSFKCINSFLTKHDFQNLLPQDRNSTYSVTPRDNFEVVKKRSGHLLNFQNEYLLIFHNHLNAKIYQLETQDKLINGIQLKLEFEPIDIIDNLIPQKLQTANHQSLISQLNALKHHHQSAAGSSSSSSAAAAAATTTTTLSPTYDENYPILTHLLDTPNRNKSVLVHNWPFGLKPKLVVDSLWNYNLALEKKENSDDNPAIESIYSNVMQDINIIKMNFNKEADALRFIRNFHGTKWLKLQNFRKVGEKVSYLPLLCETL